MRDLYSRLLELLGESEEGSVYRRFLEDIADKPQTWASADCAVLQLNETGVSLICRNGSITSVLFHIETDKAKQGGTKRYQGELPAGILPSDGRAAVEKKLGKSPSQTDPVGEEWWIEYDFQERRLTCVFGKLTEELISVSVGIKSADS